MSSSGLLIFAILSFLVIGTNCGKIRRQKLAKNLDVESSEREQTEKSSKRDLKTTTHKPVHRRHIEDSSEEYENLANNRKSKVSRSTARHGDVIKDKASSRTKGNVRRSTKRNIATKVPHLNKMRHSAASPEKNNVDRRNYGHKRDSGNLLFYMKKDCKFKEGNKAHLTDDWFECDCKGKYVRLTNPERCERSVCRSAEINPCLPGKCVDDFSRPLKYHCHCPDRRRNDSYCEGFTLRDVKVTLSSLGRRDIDATNEPMKIKVELGSQLVELKLIPRFIIEKYFKVYLIDMDDKGKPTHEEVTYPHNILNILYGHAWSTPDNKASLYVEVKANKPVKVEGILCDTHQIFYDCLPPVLDEKGSKWVSGRVSHKVSTIQKKQLSPTLPSLLAHEMEAEEKSTGKTTHAIHMDPIDFPDQINLPITVVFDDGFLEHFKNKTKEHIYAYIVTFWNKVNSVFNSATKCPKINLSIVTALLFKDYVMRSSLGKSIPEKLPVRKAMDLFKVVGQSGAPELNQKSSVFFHSSRKIVDPDTSQEIHYSARPNTPYFYYVAFHVEIESYGSVSVAVQAVFDLLVRRSGGGHLPKVRGCSSTDSMFRPDTDNLELSDCAIRKLEKVLGNPHLQPLWGSAERFFPPDLLPGSVKSVNEQCEKHVGRGDTEFVGEMDASICKKLTCCDGPEEVAMDGAADGTPCGLDKICVYGKCIHHPHPTAHAICALSGVKLRPDIDGMCDVLTCGRLESTEVSEVYKVPEGTRCKHPLHSNTICLNGECVPLNSTRRRRKFKRQGYIKG